MAYLIVDEVHIKWGWLRDWLEEGRVLLRQRLLARQAALRVFLPPLLQPLLLLLLLPCHISVVEGHLHRYSDASESCWLRLVISYHCELQGSKVGTR